MMNSRVLDYHRRKRKFIWKCTMPERWTLTNFGMNFNVKSSSANLTVNWLKRIWSRQINQWIWAELMSEIKNIFKKSFFEIPIFDVPCHFTESKSDFEKMTNHVGVHFDPNVAGRCQLIQNKDGEIRVFIGIFNNSIETLVHETTHAVLFICDAIGQSVDTNSEIAPYLNSFIFKKCREKMAI